MKQQEMCTLRSELQKEPRTISSLVAELGGYSQLMSFFQWMYDDPEMISPILLQGDDECDEHEGQPVVWDGTFYRVINAKLLMYQGWREPSGFGGKVERVVRISDKIMVG